MNECINDDSLTWMSQQLSIGQFKANMIIADPPFNIGFKYDTYNDKRTDNDYLNWTEQWLTAAKQLLSEDGNLLVCMGDEYVSDIDIMCRRKLGLVRMNWIIWHYKFGVSGTLETRKRFVRSKTHILRFARHSKPYFDAIAVATPSDRLKKYNDKRADARGKCPDDVFEFKRICGTHKERVLGIGTQMPVELFKIWIKAMCPQNGIVLDIFPGSGASLVAAKQSGRQYMGVEISQNYCKEINERLKAT